MKTFGSTTFARGPSPSYSDNVISDVNAALPLSRNQISGENAPNRIKHFCDQRHRLISTNIKPIQGRNTFAFWSIVIILLALTIANLIITLSIIGVLHLGKGIYGMELIPEEELVKFYGETDLDKIFSKNTGQFEGFVNEPVTIEGDNAPVHLRHYRNSQSSNRLTLDKEGIQFRGINTFEINDPKNGEPIFTTHRPHYILSNGANVLLTKTNSASRVVSPDDKHFKISSLDNRVIVKGSEGIQMDAANIYLQAEHVQINSTHGAIFLEGGLAGIYLNMEKIPIVNTDMGLRTGSMQYKICVCMPQGIVFRIAIPQSHNGSSKVSCAHFSSKHDPCNTN